MDKNSKQDYSSKEALENVLNNFLNKGMNVNNESKEKILNLINSLSADDIKKITDLTKNGQLQKIATNMTNKDKQKR